MNIGIAGPISLRMLAGRVEGGESMPAGYSFPFIAQLALELLRIGHTVTVFALDPGTTSPRVFNGPRLTVHVGRFRPKGRARDFFAVERADLVNAMRCSDCDIIHAHWTYEFAMAAMASGKPYLVTAHDAPLTILRFMFSPYRFIRFLMALYVIRNAHAITAVSPYVAAQLHRLGRKTNDIEVIPNGLPQDVFELAGPRYAADPTRVVTFATVLTGWSRLKNSKAALRAFAIARRSCSKQIRLVMFGAGHGPGESAQQWAQANALSEGVEFRGNTPHSMLLQYLRENVDVLVHPSLEEAHPLTLCECMAIGMAVIGGIKSGGVPFTLENGRAGVLVDVQSPAKIARAMQRLAEDDTFRHSLQIAGRKNASRRFRLDRVTEAYEAAYAAVSAGRKPARRPRQLGDVSNLDLD